MAALVPQVFLSYRRKTGSDRASLIRAHLTNRGCDVFLDHINLTSGHFDEQILKNIKLSTHFVIILFPGDLDRCKGDSQEEDWITKEVTAALQNTNCTIIPVVSQDFVWPTNTSDLPESIWELSKNNQVTWVHEYGEAALEKIEIFVKGRPVTANDCGGAVGGSIKGASGSGGDFILLVTHVSRITDIIIEKTPQLLTKWPEIIRELLEQSDIHDVRSSRRQNSMSSRIQGTLDTWINVVGNQATFNTLKGAFIKRRLKKTADELENIREELRRKS